MDKKSIALILLVVAIIFLAVSAVLVYSMVNLGSSFNLKKSSLQSTAGQIQLSVEGNEFSEVGK